MAGFFYLFHHETYSFFVVDSNLESIGMENLPAGNYTLRVLLDDGKTYTEKVVKQ